MALVLVLGLTVGAAFGGREVARRWTAEAVAIRTPSGIDEAGFVRIDGQDQWITIRGRDRRNPVLLVLHGGPGGAMSHLIALMEPLERDYVVVQWDQPGAGRTLARAGGRIDPKLDIATMVRTGLGVSEHVSKRLGRDRIVLLGWSWGSFLGVRMAQARPDLYAAYVGTGQAASAHPERDQWDYTYLLAQARAAGDGKALAVLQAVGPPPWKDRTAPQQLWRISGPYRGPMLSTADHAAAALAAPHWTLADVRVLAGGRAPFRTTVLEREVFAAEPDMAPVLPMPVVIIQGERDTNTPTDHARTWLARVRAPAKTFTVIPEAGHQALVTHNATFTQALNANLRPLLGVAPPVD